MKFCDNCGTQLEDSALFCEECGTKFEQIGATAVPVQNNEQANLNNPNQPQKLSEICTPAKRQLKDWVVVVLLILFSPLVFINLILWLPDFLFWVLYIGSQIAMLGYTWLSRKWPVWVKVAIVVAYIICYII